LMRYDARDAVLAELKALGLYRDTKDNPMAIPLCRCGCCERAQSALLLGRRVGVMCDRRRFCMRPCERRRRVEA
jgi:hypothetical protein